MITYAFDHACFDCYACFDCCVCIDCYACRAGSGNFKTKHVTAQVHRQHCNGLHLRKRSRVQLLPEDPAGCNTGNWQLS